MSETTTTAWSSSNRSSSSKVNNGGGAATASNKRPRPPPNGSGGGGGPASAAAAFIPSQKWQGSRPGYYFGTTDSSKGTGYYRDHAAEAVDDVLQPPPAATRSRRVVRIAEENNQVRTLPAAALSNAERLLQEAEAAAAARTGASSGSAAGSTSSNKPMDLSVRGVQQAALGMKKVYERNQLERAEHADDATAYMDSEVSLYEYLQSWKAVAADPPLLYPAVLDSNVVQDLVVPLLQHDNADVRIAVISLLVEWLDVSLLLNSETGEMVPAVVALAAHVLQECSELLVANLVLHGSNSGGSNSSSSSSDESDDDDDSDDEVGQGAADILTLIENLLEMDLTLTTITAGMESNSDTLLLRLVPDGSSVAMQLCRQEPSNGQTATATTSTNHHLVAWLLAQAENAKSPLSDRSLELLALLAPREDVHQLLPNWSRIPAYRSMFDDDDNGDSGDKKPAANKGKPNDKQEGAKTIDGIEILLQRVAPFRKLQQLQDSEIEALENASMILAAALYYSPQNVQAFLEAQGIELVLRCLKARTHAGGVTLRWLDFIGSSLSSSSDSSPSGSSSSVYGRACEHLIDAGALKYIFPLLMGRSLPKPAITATKSAKMKKAKLEWDHNIEQTTIRILYALTRHLTDNSPNHAKERLLAKFVENDAEKCKRIVDLCLVYDQKARAAEYKFYRSDLEETLQGLVAKDGNDDNDEESPVQLAAALNAKLKGGGELFHRLGAICAFCCNVSRTCHEQVLAHLHAKESGIGLIRDALLEFISILGDDEQKAQLASYLEQL